MKIEGFYLFLIFLYNPIPTTKFSRYIEIQQGQQQRESSKYSGWVGYANKIHGYSLGLPFPAE